MSEPTTDLILDPEFIREKLRECIALTGNRNEGARMLYKWVLSMRERFLPHDGDTWTFAHSKMIAHSFLVADAALVVAEAMIP